MVSNFFLALKNNIGIICIVFGLIAATLVLGSWLYGYWSNGLYGTHFDINSCWQGISACGMGLVGLFKWFVDSTKNSPNGEYPFPHRPPMRPMPYSERSEAESQQKLST